MAEHTIEADEYQLDKLDSRVTVLEEQMNELQIFQARSETEVKTIFSVLEEVKSMLKEYTVEMKKSIAELGIQLNTRIGTVEASVSNLEKEPGMTARERWEFVLREGLKLIVAFVLGAILVNEGVFK
jgi:chromosome segregation ATPase